MLGREIGTQYKEQGHRDFPDKAKLTDVVEISVEIRELLAQIRDALVEGEKAEPEGVDTVVIAEAEVPEPSEDEL
jgi:hypothetical protein